MKKLIQDFKEFAFKGNMLDMAVGVMIGGAIAKIVSSIVDDMVMPVIGLFTGGFNMSSLFIALDGKAYATLEAAKTAGAATLNYGVFLTYVVDFLIMAVCVFLFMKLMLRLRLKKSDTEPEPRLCPYCLGEIPRGAVRCKHCTSQLPNEGGESVTAG